MNTSNTDYLKCINSATKYPSIPTYHPLGDRGKLQPGAPLLPGIEIIATEKIHGTNARIILTPGGYFIGSREELIHFGDDVIYNPAQGIVVNIDHIAQNLWYSWQSTHSHYVTVVFGELYGAAGSDKKNGLNYTGQDNVGFRVFDVVHFQKCEWLDVLDMDLAAIAAWRDNSFQSFLNMLQLDIFCSGHGLSKVPLVSSISGENLPRTIEQTYDWLVTLLPHSYAMLDEYGQGKAEGVVIRDTNRNYIYKLRVEDYKRAMSN